MTTTPSQDSKDAPGLSPMARLLAKKKAAQAEESSTRSRGELLPDPEPKPVRASLAKPAPPVITAPAFRKRKVVRISGSRYRKFQECAKLWALDEFMYYGPEEKGEAGGFAANAGDAMHSAWQAYLRTKDMAIAEATLAMRWPWDHPFAQPTRPFWRAMDALSEVCAHPMSHYDMVYVEKDGEDVPAIELAVCLIVETPTLEIHYTGYIDAIVVDPVSGLPMVLDLKTTGDWENDWCVKYLNDTQVMGYAIIVSALTHSGAMGRRVKGAYLGTYMRSVGEAWTHAIEKEYTRADSAFFIHDLQLFAAQVNLFQNSGRFPRSAASCKNWGRTCRHLGHKCSLETLTDIQDSIDGLKQNQDAKMTEFTADFTIRYSPELYNVE